jgi:hypothetical protein
MIVQDFLDESLNYFWGAGRLALKGRVEISKPREEASSVERRASSGQS